jgi:hypothetical protein
MVHVLGLSVGGRRACLRCGEDLQAFVGEAPDMGEAWAVLELQKRAEDSFAEFSVRFQVLVSEPPPDVEPCAAPARAWDSTTRTVPD